MKTPYIFEWSGLDGNGRPQSGEVQAPHRDMAAAMLRQQGIRPSRLQRSNRGVARIRPQTLILFTRQMATLLRAGVPLLQSLQSVQRSTRHTGLVKLTGQLHHEIETGTPLNMAFRQHPEHFSPVYCSLVAAGEMAGILDDMMDKLAQTLEKQAALQSQWRSALMYPITVVCVALAVIAVVLLAVVPVFQEVFQSLGATLPWPTQVVIAASHALAIYGPVLLVLCVVAVWLRQQGRGWVQWVRRLERWQLGWPWVGELIRSVVVARWTQTLSALLSAGIPLVEALGPVAAACDHSVYARASETMREQVAQGISLNECMADSRLFPGWVVQMCAIGEETGSVDDMLARAGAMLEGEMQDRLAGLSSLLEPVIMVVLGLVIGGILVAMYLPIFQLGQVV